MAPPERQTHGWIWLRGIAIDAALIGLLPHEYTTPQPLRVDVGLWGSMGDAADAAAAPCCDYRAIHTLVLDTVLAHHVRLLETLTETLAQRLLAHFAADRVRVEVFKPLAMAPAMASVEVERCARPRQPPVARPT